MPLVYDRHTRTDCGYCGWVQLPDDSIYLVTYLKDDGDKAHIRGYRLREEDLMLPEST